MSFQLVYECKGFLTFFTCSYDTFQSILNSIKERYPVSFYFNKEEHYSIDFYFYPSENYSIHFLSIYFDFDEYDVF